MLLWEDLSRVSSSLDLCCSLFRDCFVGTSSLEFEFLVRSFLGFSLFSRRRSLSRRRRRRSLFSWLTSLSLFSLSLLSTSLATFPSTNFSRHCFLFLVYLPLFISKNSTSFLCTINCNRNEWKWPMIPSLYLGFETKSKGELQLDFCLKSCSWIQTNHSLSRRLFLFSSSTPSQWALSSLSVCSQFLQFPLSWRRSTNGFFGWSRQEREISRFSSFFLKLTHPIVWAESLATKNIHTWFSEGIKTRYFFTDSSTTGFHFSFISLRFLFNSSSILVWHARRARGSWDPGWRWQN